MLKHHEGAGHLRLAENSHHPGGNPVPVLHAESRRALEHPHRLPATEQFPGYQALSDDDVAGLVETDGRLPDRLDLDERPR